MRHYAMLRSVYIPFERSAEGVGCCCCSFVDKRLKRKQNGNAKREYAICAWFWDIFLAFLKTQQAWRFKRQKHGKSGNMVNCKCMFSSRKHDLMCDDVAGSSSVWEGVKMFVVYVEKRSVFISEKKAEVLVKLFVVTWELWGFGWKRRKISDMGMFTERASHRLGRRMAVRQGSRQNNSWRECAGSFWDRKYFAMQEAGWSFILNFL